MVYVLTALLLLAQGLLSSAIANDANVQIVGTELVYEKSKSVQMESEKLSVTPTEVKVDYIFRNTSDKPVKGLVSFPIPALFSESPYNINIAYNQWNEANDPMKFKLFVDGTPKPVKVKVETKSKDPQSPDVQDIFVTYYWEQELLPNRPTHVSHTYKPIFGSGGSIDPRAAAKKEYCMDNAFISGLKKLVAALAPRLKQQKGDMQRPEVYAHFNIFDHFAYVLKTANTWAGPIGDFTLTIDKGEPSALISFCWDGDVKKTGPTTFEMRKKNFAPASDLSVLFVHNR